MSESIKDGTGKGYEAKVDDHGRLWVSANMIDHMQHHALYHQNLYILPFDVTLGGTSETNVAFFKNIDSSKDFEIYLLDVSSNADIEFRYRFNDEYTSGGAVVTPLNTNLGSGNQIGATVCTVYEGGASADLSLSTTDGAVAHHTWMSANESHHLKFNGGLVVPAGKSVSVTAVGASTNKVTAMMIMAHHSQGYQL